MVYSSKALSATKQRIPNGRATQQLIIKYNATIYSAFSGSDESKVCTATNEGDTERINKLLYPL